MKTIRLLGILAILIFAAQTAMAADYFVRAGAAGTNNGSDWNNAYPSLPTTLIRGSVYYIAGGSYPAYTFDDAVSGTSLITIKKATASDHGTDTGWNSSYGTAQAVFSSILKFNTSYYVFDGQTRDENNWFNGDAYGIRISHNNNDQNIIIKASNISVKYVYVNAIFGNASSSTCNYTATTCRRYAIDTDGSNATGLLFHKMYVYGGNNIWFIRTTTGTIVEYSATYGGNSNSYNHGEVVNCYFSVMNAIVRYNDIRETYTLSGGGGTAIVAITKTGASGVTGPGADGLQFYGNVVSDYRVGDGAIGYTGGNSSHIRVYNNTFIRSTGYNAGTSFGTGTDNLVYNNLWITYGTLYHGGTHDYNAYSGSSNIGESHAQINVPTSILADYSGNDFRLTAATSAGSTLSSPFNHDMLEHVRGADGEWDRGAFEFGGSNLIVSRPNAPLNLSIL